MSSDEGEENQSIEEVRKAIWKRRRVGARMKKKRKSL
jgi:hypothetical protein